jgi:hypothetical protein
MKKFYFLCAGLFLTASAFAQLKTSQNLGYSESKSFVTYGKDNRGGNLLFSQDFNGGLPSDWGVNTTSGPVDWKHTTVGHTGAYPTASLASTTSGNGWMIVDSDGDNFSGGANEDTRLISPRINLTGFNNVKLEFQQMFRRWQSDVTTVQISIDSVNWTNYVINGPITQAGTPNPDFVNIDISTIAGNQPTVWIAFWWQGAWDYGWQIDDISIKEILDNDIAMKNEMFGLNAEYYKTPLNQVQPYIFSTDVENIGLLAQTSIELNIDVNDGVSSVYTGASSTIASLASFTQDSLGLSSGFTPAGIGNYTATFTVTQAETDEAPSNNSKIKAFQVTDTVYALDNNVYAGQWYNQESGPGSSEPFIFGGVYDISSNDVASSISVFIGDNSDVGVVFQANIYEWDGASWSLVGFSDLYTVGANDLDNWMHVRLITGAGLISGNSYLAAVEHYGGSDYLWIGYSSNPNPGYSVTSGDGGSTFNNQPRNPMIRLNLGSAVGIEEQSLIASNIYPNPATDLIRIDLNENINQASVEIIDITGKVVLTQSIVSSTTINVNNLARGIYTLRLYSENNVQTTQVVLTK